MCLWYNQFIYSLYFRHAAFTIWTNGTVDRSIDPLSFCWSPQVIISHVETLSLCVCIIYSYVCHTRTHIHTYMHTQIHTKQILHYARVYIHTYIHTNTLINIAKILRKLRKNHLLVYVCYLRRCGRKHLRRAYNKENMKKYIEHGGSIARSLIF